jgi:hypothetical protein
MDGHLLFTQPITILLCDWLDITVNHFQELFLMETVRRRKCEPKPYPKFVFTNTSAPVFIYMYVCIYVCMCMYVCMYTHTAQIKKYPTSRTFILDPRPIKIIQRAHLITKTKKSPGLINS